VNTPAAFSGNSVLSSHGGSDYEIPFQQVGGPLFAPKASDEEAGGLLFGSEMTDSQYSSIKTGTSVASTATGALGWTAFTNAAFSGGRADNLDLDSGYKPFEITMPPFDKSKPRVEKAVSYKVQPPEKTFVRNKTTLWSSCWVVVLGACFW
jgi:hypothetical protein